MRRTSINMGLKRTVVFQPFQYAVLRGLDILISSVSLLLFSPLLLVLVLLIKLGDPGPAIFRQQRVGRDRKPFYIKKFRTMFHDPNRSDGLVGKDSSLEEARKKFVTTAKNDSRITPIGRFLRKSHLDELPQLLNVLNGEMSLVGPRPDVPAQEADYLTQVWKKRHAVRPGITGVFQIQPTPSTMKIRNASDRYWVMNRSVWLYIVLLLATFRKIIRLNSL